MVLDNTKVVKITFRLGWPWYWPGIESVLIFKVSGSILIGKNLNLWLGRETVGYLDYKMSENTYIFGEIFLIWHVYYFFFC